MIVVVMGVSGSGKTTVGRALAERLGWEFAEGDDFHSPESKEVMSRGIALSDADRRPWLDTLRSVILDWLNGSVNGVLACSALKRSYRDTLHVGPEVRFVYLKCDPIVLEERLRERTGHFAGPSLLASQIETLEEPDSSEPAITLEVRPVSEAADEIIARFRLDGAEESE